MFSQFSRAIAPVSVLAVAAAGDRARQVHAVAGSARRSLPTVGTSRRRGRRPAVPDEALILPIGHDLGARSAAPDVRWQQVRVGSEVMELSDTEYVVWMLAHSLDEEDRLTRRGLVQQAKRFGLEAGTT